MSDKTAYILATGPSILSLSDQEKEFLKQQPYVLAMNNYLLFYEQVGVLPKDLFLSDFAHHVVPGFVETHRKASKLITQPTYYVNRKLQQLYLLKSLEDKISAIRYRFWFWRRYRYWIPLRDYGVEFVGIETFSLLQHPESKFYWGKKISEPLLHFRGSLTTAINLAALVYPINTIKLVGVDLNTYHSFYRDKMINYHRQLKGYKRPLTTGEVEGKKKDRHATALNGGGKYPGVPSIIPKIREYLNQQEIELVCCNRNSLLVTENLCPFNPLLE